MKLVIVEEGTRSELSLDRPVVAIGRGIDNDIRLSGTLVSRHHCRIEDGEGGPWMIDLGSSNGTQVNGERVDRRLLQAGDEIQIGAVRIGVEATEREEPDDQDTQLTRPAGEDDVGMRTLHGSGALRERENLKVFARITRDLAGQTELAPLLRTIVDSAVALVGGERGFLLLCDQAYGAGAGEGPPAVTDMTVRVARNFDRSDIPIPRSRFSLGIARQAVETESPMLSVDAARDERFSHMASVEDLRLRSVMCLPVRIEGQIAGVLYVDNRLQNSVFSQDDLELVELFADQATIAIQNARRVSELRERAQRLEQSRKQIERLNDQLGRKVRDRDTQLAVVRAELDRERGRYDYSAMVGASDGMRKVFQRLDRIIESNLPVLIQGESGTGKELIARAVHFNGPRRAAPFVTENCAALPDTLLESELFGHARGAFTGAHKAKKGLLEQADGGTLFLDEIGDMSTEMQKKLLRSLQEGEFRPLGSDRRIKVDVRLLAASHRNLDDLVREGSFREDLYYRVKVLSVDLPPLRERREDIPLLADHLLARAAREAGSPVPLLPHEVMAALAAYDWPGNVRELENEMRRLVVLTQGEVTLELLSAPILEPRTQQRSEMDAALDGKSGNIRAAVAELECRSIQTALERAGGNKSRAAAELGISRFALQRKLDKYGIGKTRSKDKDGSSGALEESVEGQPSGSQEDLQEGPASGN